MVLGEEEAGLVVAVAAVVVVAAVVAVEAVAAMKIDLLEPLI